MCVFPTASPVAQSLAHSAASFLENHTSLMIWTISLLRVVPGSLSSSLKSPPGLRPIPPIPGQIYSNIPTAFQAQHVQEKFPIFPWTRSPPSPPSLRANSLPSSRTETHLLCYTSSLLQDAVQPRTSWLNFSAPLDSPPPNPQNQYMLWSLLFLKRPAQQLQWSARLAGFTMGLKAS